MQASYAGPLAAYNSLTDEHLAEYFSNPRRFRHLRRMGLITRDGRIVDEGSVQMNARRKEHNQRAKEVVATTIVSKAVEIERKRRGELKKKLELLAKYELVEKVKSQKRHPACVQEFNPYQSVPPPPPRLSTTLLSHHNKLGMSLDQLTDLQQLVREITGARSVPTQYSSSPYCSNTHSPVPRPPSAPKPRTPVTVGRRSTVRTRATRPSTAPALRSTSAPPAPIARRNQVHSGVCITLCYVGKALHLEGCVDSSHSEVVVLQQHCGGNTVPLYKGKLRAKEHFTFTSKRHVGMPFGLAIYLDGLIDSRISACCEYKHQCGKFLGSKSSHFGLVKVEGGRPCYRCAAARERVLTRELQQQQSLLKLRSQVEHPLPTRGPKESTFETEAAIEQPESELDDLIRKYMEPHPPAPPPSRQLESQSEILTRELHPSASPVDLPPTEMDVESQRRLSSGSHSSVESKASSTGRKKSPVPAQASAAANSDRAPSHLPLPRSGSDDYYPILNEKPKYISLASGYSGADSSPSSPTQRDHPREDGVEASKSDAMTDYSYDDDVFEEEGEGKEKDEETRGGGESILTVQEEGKGLEVSRPEESESHKEVPEVSASHDKLTTETGVGDRPPETQDHTLKEVMGEAPSMPTEVKKASREVRHKEESGEGAALKRSTAEEGDSVVSDDRNKSPLQLPETSSQLPTEVDPSEKSATLQSILFSPERHPTTPRGTMRSQMSVSFGRNVDYRSDHEYSSDGSYSPPGTPQEPLSATMTLEDAESMLVKSPSAYSLGSLLSEKESLYASTVEVSDSEDEEMSDLERKISQIDSQAEDVPRAQSKSSLPTSSPHHSPSRISQDTSSIADDVIGITTPLHSLPTVHLSDETSNGFSDPDKIQTSDNMGAQLETQLSGASSLQAAASGNENPSTQPELTYPREKDPTGEAVAEAEPAAGRTSQDTPSKADDAVTPLHSVPAGPAAGRTSQDTSSKADDAIGVVSPPHSVPAAHVSEETSNDFIPISIMDPQLENQRSEADRSQAVSGNALESPTVQPEKKSTVLETEPSDGKLSGHSRSSSQSSLASVSSTSSSSSSGGSDRDQ